MREPVQIVEIDVDVCSLTYGTSPCAAVLGTTGVRKCFNMYRHCQDRENFAASTLTLRFAQPRPNMPKDAVYFPCLESASPRSATVNIGGADPRLAALGRRATVSVRLRDFPYHDRLTDPYQAERISGTAQTDEGGYNPADRGTFFTKLRARWPFYAGRPLRVVEGYIDGGTLSEARTRHYVITEWAVDDSGAVTIEAKDVLDLADNKKAVCPRQSSGVLALDMTINATSATLTPAGIGDLEYPASGKVVIGSEIMAFTRSGDVLTLTARGTDGTDAATHSAEDAVQLCYEVDRARLDDTLQDLIENYAGISSAFVPFADWQAEVTRWAPNLRLTTIIPKPTGVAQLIGELAVLGVSIWWDDVEQEIRLKMIRPPDGDTVFEVTDDNAIKAASVEDRDEDRLTRVAFFTVMIDPTRSDTDPANYRRQRLLIDLEAESALEYGGSRVRNVFCRWLNQGADAVTRIAGRRLLRRLSDAPQHFVMTLDAKDRGMSLTDVLRVTSRTFTDETGKPEVQLVQAIGIEDVRSGHDFRLTAQAYQQRGRLFYIAPNDAPNYDAATAEQRAEYGFMVDGSTLKFADNSEPYELI